MRSRDVCESGGLERDPINGAIERFHSSHKCPVVRPCGRRPSCGLLLARGRCIDVANALASCPLHLLLRPGAMPESIEQGAKALVHLFRLFNAARPILLLGAGASYRSGVPLASDAVRLIARAAFSKDVLGIDPDFASPKVSDVERFLHGQPWFITDPDRFAENFPLAVQHLLVPREFRRDFLQRMISPQAQIGDGYRVLTDFLLRGVCNTVLTTNFDHLVSRAMRDKESRHPHARVAEINRVPDDWVQFDVYGRRQVVYLHGSVELYTDKNLETETSHLDPGLVELIRPIFAAPLVIIGYRGAEASVMNDLLGAEGQRKNAFRNGLYWCKLKGEEVHQNVIALARTVGSNFKFVEVNGFDELMVDISRAITDEQVPSDAYQWHTRAGRAPDEQVVESATVEDLDQAIATASLARYAERLRLPRVSAANLRQTLVELGLVRESNGVSRPTFAAYLLFGKDVAERFPAACVAVTIASKNRRIFAGNLITQYNELLEFLTSEQSNPPVRLKTSASSEEQSAYPPRALLELLVNLLVHRDYERSGFSHINVTPGTRIEFVNPASMSAETATMLGVRADGSFEPLREVTEILNPSLADIFYGLGPMDKAGSGLADVAELMLGSGGTAQFAFDRTGEFRAEILQARQPSVGSLVALPRSHVGIYTTNLLPFSVMPARLYAFDILEGALDGLDHQSLGALPIFVLSHGRMWSFGDPSHFGRIMRKTGGKLDDYDSLPIRDVERDADLRNRLIWLLNKHWEFYLRTFAPQGLRMDQTQRRRAFFTLVTGTRNTIVYDSAQRRGVRRDVVKPRADGRWHENEGIGYHAVQYDNSWAVQIKPFYMFTRQDGTTPMLPSMRSARATRRMKFDRNKSVADDLSFWARFLSRGSSVIDIGGRGVQDLLLSASFKSFEVMEPKNAPAG